FLTDFLDGDRYYSVTRPNHNLERCRTQLALLVAMTRAEAELSRLMFT
nr:aminoglycoside phosphotransferase family protein [Gemmatimonadaceae bacterium]